MEEKGQPRTKFEGVKPPVLGVSSSSSHETSKSELCPKEEEDMFVASDSFCSTMCAMISKPDIEKMGQIQLEAITRFQGMNARFNEFNRHSFERYEKLNLHFQNHTRMIIDMKKDLDIIFRRIRNLKTKLTKQYGGAFAVTSANIQKLEEEIEADHEGHQEEKPKTHQQGSPSGNDHSKNTLDDGNTSRNENTVDQPLGASLSVTGNASGSWTNDIRKEKHTFAKPSEQEEVQRSVLRPQLSSSDDDYSVEETNIRTEQMVDQPLAQEVQKSVLRPQLSSSDDNYSAEEMNIRTEQMVDQPLSQEVQESVLRPQFSSFDDDYSAEESDEDKQTIQDHSNPKEKDTSNLEASSKVNKTTTLCPEISSSDESLEDDTDDESDEVSETYPGRCVSTSPSSEEEVPNTQMPSDKKLYDVDDKES